MLGMARSFRSGPPKSLITHGENTCTVFGERQGAGGAIRPLGVSRALDGTVTLRLDGETIRSVSQLADELPLLLINAESFELLTGQPQQRRRFLDWGVFHVEHDFREHGQRFQRALVQRNHLLRRGRITPGEIAPWDQDLARCGEAVSQGRERFIERLKPVFAAVLEELAPELGEIALRYRRGWDSQTSYLELLQRSLQSDSEQGFTQSGPQRADLRVSAGAYSAAETLSRGQQKLVVCALKLAQGQILAEQRADPGLYLIDDLPSELDAERCERVCRCLATIGAQTLLTCVDSDVVQPAWLVPHSSGGVSGEAANGSSTMALNTEKGQIEATVAMFHVEQGHVEAQSIRPL